MKTTARVFAPATSANLAAGFDSLGAALAPEDGTLWGDIVTATLAPSTTLLVTGEFAGALPAEPRSNLAWMAMELFRDALTKRNISFQPMTIHLEKHLPVASGLGSSASTIVASLVAYNVLHGCPLDRQEILDCAALAEAGTSGARHFDNVAPSLLGGLQLVTPSIGTLSNPCVALPFQKRWRLVVAHPGFELSTRAAREVLPRELPLKSVVEQTQLLAGFVAALFREDADLLVRCARDLIAEPRRAELVPGYAEVKRAALEAGALFCNLSGSGPSVFAWCDAQKADTIRDAMRREFIQKGLTVRAHVCGLDTLGAREV